ncbi:MAG TPA: hypothetical protein VFT53_03405 [Candidatus Saccharimonadales bacterium]|nr:hypothetical protein [Candidatus Saccharimonadales bacterium]
MTSHEGGPQSSEWPYIDPDSMSDEEKRELLDRILGDDEGDPLGIFQRELGEEWDNLSPDQRQAILDEFPELMGGGEATQ